MKPLSNTECSENLKAISGAAFCPGSFGEILQGMLPSGEKFLVNLKIKSNSRAAFKIPGGSFARNSKYDFTRLHDKSRACVDIFLRENGVTSDYGLFIESELPCGAGLSSSTADMTASLYACSEALGISISKEKIDSIISSIEPGDGLHYEGTAAYLHEEGRLIFNINYIPGYQILAVNTGPEINTLEFNQKNYSFLESERIQYEKLLKDVKAALENRDDLAIAFISTKSALLWQKILYKKEIPILIEASEKYGGIGIVNCHSGNSSGILFSRETDLRQAELELKKYFNPKNISIYETLDSLSEKKI